MNTEEVKTGGPAFPKPEIKIGYYERADRHHQLAIEAIMFSREQVQQIIRVLDVWAADMPTENKGVPSPDASLSTQTKE